MDPLFDDRRCLIPFRSSLLPQIFTDTLVIGGGVAGARAAIEAAQHGEVIVLAKGDLSASNTSWAQGGIAGVKRGPDSSEAHLPTRSRPGRGCATLRRRGWSSSTGAGARGTDVMGVRFDAGPDGLPCPGSRAAISSPRIYHAGGDTTGAEIQRALPKAAPDAGAESVWRPLLLDLATASAEPARAGARRDHASRSIRAPDDLGQDDDPGLRGRWLLYRETSNPRVATADGLAMAYRAGATLADMAFVQFHPTTLYLPGASRTLISEAVRGEGALLLDAGGRRFMPDVHPLAELAPRDVVSQAIVRQIAKQGGRHVWLDCRGISGFHARFPGIASMLARFDLDPSRDLIPVHPAAHYMIGGVRTDLRARTDVPGLLAVGEAASTGLHGANRLASNSLLEGLVFGRLAGQEAGAAMHGAAPRQGPVPIVSDIRPSDHAEIDLADVRSSLRSAIGECRHGAHRRQAARCGPHVRLLGPVHPRQDLRRPRGLGGPEPPARGRAGHARRRVARGVPGDTPAHGLPVALGGPARARPVATGPR